MAAGDSYLGADQRPYVVRGNRLAMSAQHSDRAALESQRGRVVAGQLRLAQVVALAIEERKLQQPPVAVPRGRSPAVPRSRAADDGFQGDGKGFTTVTPSYSAPLSMSSE